ncbi:MAG TPA: nucleotidyltransferase domain-containing protein [Arenibaculum sp.]|nr:nucleotidyltransferase domain-containing protein [Arenibaculum sp.]
MSFSDLDNEQIRQLVDAEQIFLAWREAERERRHRYAGSMAWKTIHGHDYLYRKIGQSSKSLGRRSPETENAKAAFEQGRKRNADLVKGLRGRIERMAPVNRALRLGRLPRVCARVLRRLDMAGLLGRNIRVVGTNALFAYERAAAVQVSASIVATGDVDIPYDARTRLKLSISSEIRREGMIGLLRSVDTSFTPSRGNAYRAVNRDGFMVDLITPPERDPTLPRRLPDRLSSAGSDLVAAEIQGLAWLAYSPVFEQVVMGEDGVPLCLSCPDPRVFALHKLWLCDRTDRDPGKRRRDRTQAAVAAKLCRERLGLSFDDPALQVLPAALRGRANELMEEMRERDEEAGDTEPDWL